MTQSSLFGLHHKTTVVDLFFLTIYFVKTNLIKHYFLIYFRLCKVSLSEGNFTQFVLRTVASIIFSQINSPR